MTTEEHTGTLQLRRLAWAGVEIRLKDTCLLIDALENVEGMAPVLGPPKRPMPPVDAPAGTHALISHLHPDHYDQELLMRLAPTGTVGCHTPAAQTLIDAGIAAIPQELWNSRQIGPLTVTPVTSLDWRGDDQVAWIVEGAGQRIIHCGDTQWHGSWWQIGRDHGPFDVAFLPVNGVVARFDGYDATVPVTMTPEQAVEAAVALGSTSACAIHYGLFHNPPTYVEQTDIEQRFLEAAQARGVVAVLPDAGDLVPVVSRTARVQQPA